MMAQREGAEVALSVGAIGALLLELGLGVRRVVGGTT